MSMMRPHRQQRIPRQEGHRGASQIENILKAWKTRLYEAWPQARVQAGLAGPGLSGPSLKEKVELEV